MRIVYITAKDRKEAKKISSTLLEKKLIACANIFPIESMFWWNGKICDNKEYVLLAKTKDSNYKKVEQATKKIHSYEMPAIYSWKTDKADRQYTKWIENQTGK